MILPFGKHRGKDIGEIPSNYLTWLLEQDWMEEDQYDDLFEEIAWEMATRERSDAHFYD